MIFSPKVSIFALKTTNGMQGLSKSRYTAFCQCPKNLWMKVYKPEEAKDDPGYTEKENGPPGGETGLTPSEYRESKVFLKNHNEI
jgi:hypothetical protein